MKVARASLEYPGQSWLNRRFRTEEVAKQLIFELILALMVVETVLALIRIKSSQSKSMGPSWRVMPMILHENSMAGMRQMLSGPRNAMR